MIPHTTEVLPSLTRAEDGAVETEPAKDERSTTPPREATVQEGPYLCLRLRPSIRGCRVR